MYTWISCHQHRHTVARWSECVGSLVGLKWEEKKKKQHTKNPPCLDFLKWFLFQVSPVYFHFVALVRFSSGECNLLLANHQPETQKFRNYRNISGKQRQNFSCTNRILYRAPLFKHFNLCERKLHVPMSTAWKESLFSFPRHSGKWSALLQPTSSQFNGWISHHIYGQLIKYRGNY